MTEVIGPIVMGVVVAIINLIFMIKSESGDAKTVIGHGFGELVYLIPLAFLAFNIDFVLNLGFLPEVVKNKTIILVALGLIAAILVHVKSALFPKARGAGTHEKWIQSLIVGALIALSPFIWGYIGPWIKEIIGI